jgi:hypothetical protein
MFAQTVGVKPRQKSGAQRICFCPQCAVSLAMGMPPEGALNLAAWDMIRDIVSAEPSLNYAAWESLRGGQALLGTGEDSESKAVSQGGVNWGSHVSYARQRQGLLPRDSRDRRCAIR